jgi:hypothetical protein
MTSGFAGQLLPLSISATDANQDRLTFRWTQVSPAGEQGTFFENGSANAQRWSSPETPTPAERLTMASQRGSEYGAAP